MKKVILYQDIEASGLHSSYKHLFTQSYYISYKGKFNFVSTKNLFC